MILEVTRTTTTTPNVRTLTLRDPDGGELPAYPPGAHLVLNCDGIHNAYSLHGPVPQGTAPTEYQVSVLRTPDGQGGSDWVHRAVRPGTRINALPPRGTFTPAATATSHLLIAGGIGITPLLGHVRAAHAWRRPYRLIYAHRENSPTHLQELRALCGPRLQAITGGREELRTAARRVLADQPLGTHAYICGPPGMIDLVLNLAKAAGWPEERLHTERFTTPEGPREPFTANLARTGETVHVGPDESLLEALERAGRSLPHLCRRGVCGECRTLFTKGTPDHRDLVLSKAERETTLMPCVSRATTDLELDL